MNGLNNQIIAVKVEIIFILPKSTRLFLSNMMDFRQDVTYPHTHLLYAAWQYTMTK